MGGDMFQRSHLELLFIVPSTSFRSAVRAFIRAARATCTTTAQQPCSGARRLLRPTTKGQSALSTRCRRARTAARHAPAKKPCAPPPPNHQRPVCTNYIHLRGAGVRAWRHAMHQLEKPCAPPSPQPPKAILH